MTSATATSLNPNEPQSGGMGKPSTTRQQIPLGETSFGMATPERGATVSETSAAKALCGEIPIPGHMPVNLSNASGPGAKIDHPAGVANVRSPN